MPRKVKSILELPQTSDAWYCAARRLRLWVENESDPDRFLRPYLLAVVNMSLGDPLILDITSEFPPTPALLRDRLFEVMRKPLKGAETKAGRPAQIHVEDQALVGELGPLLAEANIPVVYHPEPENMAELTQAILDEVTAGEEVDEIPGLLGPRGVTPEQVGRVFAAAAGFYRAAPWTVFGTLDLLSIRVGRQKEPYYAAVMGHEGENTGLMVFQKMADVHAVFTAEDASEIYGKNIREMFFFNPPPIVSFDDQDAAEQYGWPLPAPELYPVPLTYHGDHFGRPKADMLRWYEGALQAIPALLRRQLPASADGNPPLVEAHFEFPSGSGMLKVHIRFPAADLSQYEGVTPPWALEMLDDELDEDEEDLFEFDEEEPEQFAPESIEKLLKQIVGGPGSQKSPQDAALDRAQGLMYDAWEETNRKRRVAIAHQALQISPNCADAYNLLADDEAKNPQEALRLYEMGIQAGRRALGEKFLQDPRNLGAYWGLLETRPFMRAMAGYAHTVWALERNEEAEKTFREILRLNHSDNQGVRYPLLALLMGEGREHDVEALLGEYEGDWSPEWAYTIALLSFRKLGASVKAKKQLDQALDVNPYVPDYLTGKKPIPTHMPETITLGGEDQAYAYAAEHRRFWRDTPGAIEWLEGSRVRQMGKSRR
jgi:tetratricopeptide (TPR) repeat protein